MFAVVDVAGQQLKVSPSERIYVPRLSSNVGSAVKFDRVLLLADDKMVKVGNPFVRNAVVEAKVLGHVKDEKVIVFKKKKRKGYRVRRGHRQQYTEVEITSIG
ncbi:MAG: 50S ribosomal protein L21 [Ignavibacteriae bacterium]|nr:50S ribosomal protein L21 [Ignavibacteria bacterium]MBI3365298.1 50S ribosomal protein L21 [Ignavibacteriota bacterium]